jgi:glutathione S-transferase
MKLIGMLDSPYVRRVAIALELHGIAFEHEAVSVFSTFEKFQSINPVVKAPTLICDDGEMIMESSLILQFIEATKTGRRSLWSQDPTTLQQQFRALSLALAASEKSIQIVYEQNLRPAAAQYQPWLERVRGQLLAAYAGLEQELTKHAALFAETSHASIATAIAWQFTQSELPAAVSAVQHPLIANLAQRLEQLPAFLKYPPIGPGVQGVK